MKISIIPLFCLLSLSIVSCSVQEPKLPELEAPVTTIGGWTEGQRSFTGPVSLKRSPESGKIIGIGVPGPSGEEETACWEIHDGNHKKLDPQKTYKVTFLTRFLPWQRLVQSKLLRIEHDGRTIIDESVCHVHGEPMVRQMQIEKSAVDYPDGFVFSVRQNKFPNDGNVYLACGSGVDHPTWKCLQCERNFKAYMKRHYIGSHDEPAM